MKQTDFRSIKLYPLEFLCEPNWELNQQLNCLANGRSALFVKVAPEEIEKVVSQIRSEDASRDQSVRLADMPSLSIAGLQGRRFELSSSGDMSWMVLAPFGGHTIMIIARFSDYSPMCQQEIESLLSNSRISPVEVAEPVTDLLRFDDSGRIKLAWCDGDHAFATVDGEFPVRSANHPLIAISLIRIQLFSPQYLAFMRNRLESRGASIDAATICPLSDSAFAITSLVDVSHEVYRARFYFLPKSVLLVELVCQEESLSQHKDAVEHFFDSIYVVRDVS